MPNARPDPHEGLDQRQDLRLRLQKQWDKGRLLSARLTAEPLFPLRIALKCPGPRELGDRYGAVKDWIDDLVRHAGSGRAKYYDLEWRQVNHRQLGRNQLPVAAIFQQPADAFNFIGRQKQAEDFDVLCRRILDAFPDLRRLAGPQTPVRPGAGRQLAQAAGSTPMAAGAPPAPYLYPPAGNRRGRHQVHRAAQEASVRTAGHRSAGRRRR